MLDGNIAIPLFLLMLFISVSVHEMMHAFVAYRLGDDLAHSHGRISLNPFRHIDPYLTIALPAGLLLLGLPIILAAKPVPINTNRISGDEVGLAAVGLAGPLTNLFLASFTAVLLRYFLPVGDVYEVMQLFIRLNVALFVFNMIPLPPLDGSRLLYAVAPSSVQRVMERIESMGMFAVLAMIFILLPFLSPLISSGNQFILNILLP